MNEWMNHPKMQNMDPIKLELIKMAAAQTAGKSGKDRKPAQSQQKIDDKAGCSLFPSQQEDGDLQHEIVRVRGTGLKGIGMDMGAVCR